MLLISSEAGSDLGNRNRRWQTSTTKVDQSPTNKQHRWRKNKPRIALSRYFLSDWFGTKLQWVCVYNKTKSMLSWDTTADSRRGDGPRHPSKGASKTVKLQLKCCKQMVLRIVKLLTHAHGLNFSKLIFVSTLVFTYSKCLQFSHSSMLD